MSINYYFRDINRYAEIEQEQMILKSKIDKIIELVKDITDEEDVIWKIINELETNSGIIDDSDIHIGQRNGSWVALLQEQPDYYKTVPQMKDFYHANLNKYIIVDEYGKKLSWDEFEKEFLSHKGKERGYKKSDGYYWEYGDFD